MNGAHLVVRLGPQRVALPAAAIERVVRGLNILPLPGAAAATVGLAEFAGEPLAVVDLGHWLGVRRTRPASSALRSWRDSGTPAPASGSVSRSTKCSR